MASAACNRRAPRDERRAPAADASPAGLIFLAVWAVHEAHWISLPALGATIIVTHLGLLVWEMRYLAISLANPGLKPARS